VGSAPLLPRPWGRTPHAAAHRVRAPRIIGPSLETRRAPPAAPGSGGAALSRVTLEPVAPSSRIVEVDVVRGFALFGVLLVNVYGFGADSIAWDAPADRLTFAITRIFFEWKSWTLFSILFGFGFALQLGRAEARGSRVLPLMLRRLAVLFALGAAHALLFDGDILMLYAELGLGLLLARRLPTRLLLAVALGLLLVFPLVRLASLGGGSEEPEEIGSVAEAREDLAWDQRTHVYATGSLAEVAADNTSAIPADPLEDIATPESGLAVFAMFLLGLCIHRSRILEDIPRHAALIARVRTWGLTLGLAAMAAQQVLAAIAGYTAFGPQAAGLGSQLAGDLLVAIGTPALALGYAALLLLAAQTPRGGATLGPLAPVGRLALTVYLVQTLAFTTVFYGYGFGQAFRLGPVAVSAGAVILFVAQVLACVWWSRRFRFGPVEWLWRSATYLRWQPLRLRASRRAADAP